MHGDRYGVGMDSQGRNEVTGEGSGAENVEKTFTCTDLEVFAVKFE